MGKLFLFAVCITMAALLGACAVKPPPVQETTAASTTIPETTETPETTEPEQAPVFDTEALQPLLYRIGIALSRDYVEDFDAARGAMADRCFTDALLYEFLNDELYDPRIQVSYGEEYSCMLTAEDMLFLLRQHIGDYPRLIDPTVDMFLFRTDTGGYLYWHSDLGMIDYDLRLDSVTTIGGGVFDARAELFERDDSEGTTESLGKFTLYLAQAEDSAYGFTITKVTKGWY